MSRLGQWWWRAVDPHAVALMRVLLGVMLISGHYFYWEQLTTLIGPDAPVAEANMFHRPGDVRWSIYWLARSATEVQLIHLLGLVPFVGVLLGWRTRWMLLLSWVVLTSLYHAQPWAQHGGDRLLRLWCLYLCFTDNGAALSLDARRRAAKGRPVPVSPMVGLRLMQLQLCIMYIVTAAEKSPGSSWLNGTALYYALSAPHFQRIPALSELLTQHSVFLVPLAIGGWVTIAWEWSFPVLVWWRRTRPFTLAMGVLLHGMIFLLMTVGSFSPVTVWGYGAFLDDKALGDRVRRLVARWSPPPAAEEAA